MTDKQVDTVKPVNSALPAHLQHAKTAKFGQIDVNRDLIIPRVKLLQSTSPEVEEFTNAKVGQFWHTIAQEPLGQSVRIVPLVLKPSIVLWPPRNDDRGVLARSSDTINWDEGYANMEFEVKIKGVAQPVKYLTKSNVAESGLAEFGSGIPGDPNSRPAASLTYNMLFYFPDFHDFSPAVIINTRSSIKPAKQLISKIEMSPVEHYGMVFQMKSTDEQGDEGPYKGYKYVADGYADEAIYNAAKELYARFEPVEWSTNEESDETAATAGPTAGKTAGSVSDKF